MINNSQLEKLLQNIPDVKQRELLRNIATGKVVKQIRCMSKACSGRIVAHVLDNGRLVTVASPKVKGGENFMWLRSSRDRLDGNKGFECWCGNDSRLAPQEKGYIDTKGNAPTKADLSKIFEKVQNEPSDYIVINGAQNIDGFVIEGAK